MSDGPSFKKGDYVTPSEKMLAHPLRARFRGRIGRVNGPSRDGATVWVRWKGLSKLQQMWFTDLTVITEEQAQATAPPPEPAATSERTQCQQCRAWGPPGEYHPFTFCLLVKATGDAEVARAHINAILEYGRRLERLKLPNDAPISLVHAPTERGDSESESPPPQGPVDD